MYLDIITVVQLSGLRHGPPIHADRLLPKALYPHLQVKLLLRAMLRMHYIMDAHPKRIWLPDGFFPTICHTSAKRSTAKAA